jgi:phosphatidyl-myo-inositol dimannoside synthase
MKVCIICSGFNKYNIPLQPWRYLYELSRYMNSKGLGVEFISDAHLSLPYREIIDNIVIHYITHIRPSISGNSENLLKKISEISPDVILWSMDAKSFCLVGIMDRLNIPIISLWMGTTYSKKYILSLGLRELAFNFSSIYGHALNSLVPTSLIRFSLKRAIIKRIIVLNESNKSMLIKFGISSNKICVIPPGIEYSDLEFQGSNAVCDLRNELGMNENDFIVSYFGSPLSLRGIDLLIKAVSQVSKNIPFIKLVILSRRRINNLEGEENLLKKLCINEGIKNKINVVSGFLEKDKLKNFIAVSDIVALPFKLVQADSPISILEAMSLGKTVISTKLDGIPDLLKDNRGYLVSPNNLNELVDAILTLNSDRQMRNYIGNNAREYMLKYPSWNCNAELMIKVIRSSID